MNRARWKIFLCIVILHYLGTDSAHAQVEEARPTLSCSYSETPLREIIEDVARKTEVRFVYSDHLVDGKQADCQIQTGSLEEILDEIMSPAGIGFRILPHQLVVLYTEKPEQDNEYLIEEKLSDAFIQPRLDTKIEPDYPFEAQREGLEGSVDMRLFVDQNGKVTKTRVNASSGYRVLDEAAMAFVEKLRFNPAMRDGRPVGVWVSRVLNYTLVERQFLPTEYMSRIQEYHELAGQAVGEERRHILQQILHAHENLVLYLNAKPDLNYNRYIERVVKSEVFETWRHLIHEEPLHFIVFHDFVVRFPNSMEAIKARQYLVNVIHDEMAHILAEHDDSVSPELKDNAFFLALYRFLEREYPESLDATLRTVVRTIEES